MTSLSEETSRTKSVPLVRARKLKKTLYLVNGRGRLRIVSIHRWGKNWAVTTEDGHFYCVAGDKLLEVER
jgi:hypothetical protein